MNVYEQLLIFCRDNLRSDLDPYQYASGLWDELPDGEGPHHVEIRGLHTATGNPASTWIEGR